VAKRLTAPMATIGRQLGRLSSTFNRARELDKLTDNHIPSFVLPEDSKPRKGFLDPQGFQKLHDAMKITGHKTERVFERRNIKTTEDIREAFIKVGQFSRASVTPIAEKSSTR
jgi:hypothetical protein